MGETLRHTHLLNGRQLRVQPANAVPARVGQACLGDEVACQRRLPLVQRRVVAAAADFDVGLARRFRARRQPRVHAQQRAAQRQRRAAASAYCQRGIGARPARQRVGAWQLEAAQHARRQPLTSR